MKLNERITDWNGCFDRREGDKHRDTTNTSKYLYFLLSLQFSVILSVVG